ncbi:MAG: hypothetical protein AAGD92_14400 [Pseudomonadota bacterium]
MKKFATIFAAVFAMTSAHAVASPFNYSASTEADASAKSSLEKQPGLLEIATQKTINALSLIVTVGDKKEKSAPVTFKSEKQDRCEVEEEALSTVDVRAVKRKALIGPEPIYFGF